MKQLAFQIQNIVERDLGAVGQEQESLVVINLLHNAGDSDICAA